MASSPSDSSTAAKTTADFFSQYSVLELNLSALVDEQKHILCNNKKPVQPKNQKNIYSDCSGGEIPYKRGAAETAGVVDSIPKDLADGVEVPNLIAVKDSCMTIINFLKENVFERCDNVATTSASTNLLNTQYTRDAVDAEENKIDSKTNDVANQQISKGEYITEVVNFCNFTVKTSQTIYYLCRVHSSDISKYIENNIPVLEYPLLDVNISAYKTLKKKYESNMNLKRKFDNSLIVDEYEKDKRLRNDGDRATEDSTDKVLEENNDDVIEIIDRDIKLFKPRRTINNNEIKLLIETEMKKNINILKKDYNFSRYLKETNTTSVSLNHCLFTDMSSIVREIMGQAKSVLTTHYTAGTEYTGAIACASKANSDAKSIIERIYSEIFWKDLTNNSNNSSNNNNSNNSNNNVNNNNNTNNNVNNNTFPMSNPIDISSVLPSDNSQAPNPSVILKMTPPAVQQIILQPDPKVCIEKKYKKKKSSEYSSRSKYQYSISMFENINNTPTYKETLHSKDTWPSTSKPAANMKDQLLSSDSIGSDFFVKNDINYEIYSGPNSKSSTELENYMFNMISKMSEEIPEKYHYSNKNKTTDNGNNRARMKTFFIKDMRYDLYAHKWFEVMDNVNRQDVQIKKLYTEGKPRECPYKPKESLTLNEIIVLGLDPLLAGAKGCTDRICNIYTDKEWRLPLEFYYKFAMACKNLLFSDWKPPIRLNNIIDNFDAEKASIRIIKQGLSVWGQFPTHDPFKYKCLPENVLEMMTADRFNSPQLAIPFPATLHGAQALSQASNNISAKTPGGQDILANALSNTDGMDFEVEDQQQNQQQTTRTPQTPSTPIMQFTKQHNDTAGYHNLNFDAQQQQQPKQKTQQVYEYYNPNDIETMTADSCVPPDVIKELEMLTENYITCDYDGLKTPVMPPINVDDTVVSTVVSTNPNSCDKVNNWLGGIHYHLPDATT